MCKRLMAFSLLSIMLSGTVSANINNQDQENSTILQTDEQRNQEVANKKLNNFFDEDSTPQPPLPPAQPQSWYQRYLCILGVKLLMAYQGARSWCSRSYITTQQWCNARYDLVCQKIKYLFGRK